MLPLCMPHSKELLQVLSTRSQFLSLLVYNNYPIVTQPTVHCKSDFVQQSCSMLSCLGVTTMVFSLCKILLQGWQIHPHLPLSSGPPLWIAEHFNPGTLNSRVMTSWPLLTFVVWDAGPGQWFKVLKDITGSLRCRCFRTDPSHLLGQTRWKASHLKYYIKMCFESSFLKRFPQMLLGVIWNVYFMLRRNRPPGGFNFSLLGCFLVRLHFSISLSPTV